MPSAALPSTSPTWTATGLNLGIRVEKKGTNSLINGTNLKRFTYNYTANVQFSSTDGVSDTTQTYVLGRVDDPRGGLVFQRLITPTEKLLTSPKRNTSIQARTHKCLSCVVRS
jgi:hypothetical protein